MAAAPAPATPTATTPPGWMNASYWLSLVGVVVTVLVVTGLVPATESATIAALATDLITKFFVLVTALVPFWQFLHTKVQFQGLRPSPDAQPVTPTAPVAPVTPATPPAADNFIV